MRWIRSERLCRILEGRKRLAPADDGRHIDSGSAKVALMFGRGSRQQATPVPDVEVASQAPTRAPPLASAAVLLACGAGVGFWWWTQWARGRAESESESGERNGAAGDLSPDDRD